MDSDECLYSYRVHDDSLSGRHAEKIASNAEELIRYHRERLEFHRAPFAIRIETDEAETDLLNALDARGGGRDKTATLRRGPHGLMWPL